MAESFRCVVAIPTRELFSGDVYYADVPGMVGQFGVMRGHESTVTVNQKGGKLTLWLDPEGNERKEFLLHLGGTQMLNNHLSVLGRFGCAVEDIDVADVKQKAEELRAEIEARKATIADVDEPTTQRQRVAASWISNEETHLGWYEAQIAYAEAH